MFFFKKHDEPLEGLNNTIRTVFKDTPKLPTYLLAITVFNKNDFKGISGKTSSGKTVIIFNKKNICLAIVFKNN